MVVVIGFPFLTKEEEWNDMLKELKNGTAPGISGISYILIKRANRSTQSFFREFISSARRAGIIVSDNLLLKIIIISSFPFDRVFHFLIAS